MEPIETVRAFTRLAWSEGRLDEARALLADDLVDHDAMPFPGREPGAGGLLKVVAMIRAALPDLERHVDEEYASGDRVTTSFTDRGTHTGELFGIPPTGRAVAVRGINVARVKDGRISELRHVEDLLGLMRQLGVAPG
jgi:steroid delta-isomerase-like uncharacterized protein